MAPFRPTNINKRYYPGNASVVGPTCTTTLGLSTTTCCSSTNTCAACACQPLNLGCRCSFCACPCCNVCCCCKCTVCTPSVPSGRWSSFEVYEASTRGAWGGAKSSSDTPVCLCCTNVGFACTANIVDYKGFFFCCGGATKYFVSPYCTEYGGSWPGRGGAVTNANTCMGSCGWYVPSQATLYTGALCRTYWDGYQGRWYWGDDVEGGVVHLDGRAICRTIPANQPHASARAFRQV